MFYATRIKEISDDKAVDVQGKVLSFIGYLPVEVGDTVFTDGNVIFGYSKVKGGYNIFSDKVKFFTVPVLGDKYLLSELEEELRGYLNNRGKYKKYRIAGTNWIVNSKKLYAHDLNAENIIDAYIADNGETFVATSGFYKKSQAIELHYPVLIPRGNIVVPFNSSYKYISCSPKSPHPYPLILGSNSFGDENTKARILKKDFQTDELNFVEAFDLEPYAIDIEARALQCSENILEQSYNEENLPLDIFDYVSWQELDDRNKNYFRGMYEVNDLNPDDYFPEDYFLPEDIMTRPDTFIAHTYAHIITCNIGKDGLSGIVFATSYGYCFPYIKPRFVYRLPPLDPTLTISGREPRVLREWKCVPFGVSALYEFSNGEMTDIISFREFGGLNTGLTTVGDETNIDYAFDPIYQADSEKLDVKDLMTTRQVEIIPSSEVIETSKLFPVGTGFFQMNKYGQLTFYNSKKEKVAENIPIHDDFIHMEIGAAEFWDAKTYGASKSRYEDIIWADSMYRFPLNDKPDILRATAYMPDGRDANAESIIEVYLNTKVEDSNSHLVAVYEYRTGQGSIPYEHSYEQGGSYYCKRYTADDDFPISLTSILIPDESHIQDYREATMIIPPFDGYYIKKRASGRYFDLEPLQFTPLFYDLGNGNYLYGVKDSKLYHKAGDTETVIGDGLKNFRLQEMKNIQKATK